MGEASLNQVPALAANADRVLLVFRHGSGPGADLRAVGLDRAGHVLFNRALETGVRNPGHARLAEGADGLHLLWSGGTRGQTLLYGRLGWSGDWLTPPQALVEDGLDEGHTLAPLADGGAYAVFSDPDGALRGVRISPRGGTSDLDSLSLSGRDPYLQWDASGTLHLAWISQQGGRHELLYGRLQVGEAGTAARVADERTVGQFQLGTGQVDFGPVLGLAPDHGHVLWSIESRGGLSAGSAEAFYVRFPLAGGTAAPAAELELPGRRPARYATGVVPGTSAIPPEGLPSSFVHHPSVPGGSHDPLPVAATAALAGRTRTHVQPVVAYLGDGGVLAWEEAGHVTGVSAKPTLRQGPEGEWHAAWLTVGGSYTFPVYYASTLPAVKAHLDTRTTSDVRETLTLYGWSLLAGLGLGPIMVALWAIPAGLWLIVFFLVSASDNLRERRVQAAFGVAVLVYLLAQLAITPGLLVTLPWLAGLNEAAFSVAVVLAPILILLVATAATTVIVRRRQITSLAKAFALFVLVDALLVMVLYLPGFVLVN